MALIVRISFLRHENEKRAACRFRALSDVKHQRLPSALAAVSREHGNLVDEGVIVAVAGWYGVAIVAVIEVGDRPTDDLARLTGSLKHNDPARKIIGFAAELFGLQNLVQSEQIGSAGRSANRDQRTLHQRIRTSLSQAGASRPSTSTSRASCQDCHSRKSGWL